MGGLRGKSMDRLELEEHLSSLRVSLETPPFNPLEMGSKNFIRGRGKKGGETQRERERERERERRERERERERESYGIREVH
jgi:hypothetical protein